MPAACGITSVRSAAGAAPRFRDQRIDAVGIAQRDRGTQGRTVMGGDDDLQPYQREQGEQDTRAGRA